MQQTDFDLLHNISAGKHFYQFYKTSEDYLKVIAPYLQSGLEKGEACLWLVSAKIGVERACDYVRTWIPQAAASLACGRLQILSGEEWYLTGGEFDEAKAIANALKYLEQVQKQGFKILRGSGDAGAIPRTDWPKVQIYEKKMAPWIKSQPVIALCAYPILECTLTETKAVLDCHDDVLIGRF